MQDPTVPREADYSAIDAFLHCQYVPHEYCAFAALSKLPPAHILVLDGGRLEQKRYWKLSYADQVERPDAEIHGLGETALPPVPAAIGNALGQLGLQVNDLPISAEDVLAAVERRDQEAVRA